MVEEYFDLGLDYSKIKNTLKKIDKYMEESINFGEGIRILNQDLWETIISFIISANNNIPRIKKIINNISEKYGNLIEWRDQKRGLSCPMQTAEPNRKKKDFLFSQRLLSVCPTAPA